MVDDCRPRSHYCGAVDRAGQRGERGYAKKKVAAAKTKADAAKEVAVLGAGDSNGSSVGGDCCDRG